MSLHNLVSMKRTKKDKKRHNSDHAIGSNEASFPFGLTISLDDESLTKLGIDELPAVGEEWIVLGIGKVDSVSKSSNERRVSRNVSIQLEKLEVGPLKAGKLAPKTAEDAVTEAIKDV